MCVYVYVLLHISILYTIVTVMHLFICVGQRLYGYLGQRVPRHVLAISFRICSNCEVIKGMSPWSTSRLLCVSSADT